MNRRKFSFHSFKMKKGMVLELEKFSIFLIYFERIYRKFFSVKLVCFYSVASDCENDNVQFLLARRGEICAKKCETAIIVCQNSNNM